MSSIWVVTATGCAQELDREETLRGLRVLCDQSHGVELRAPPSYRSVHGRGDDPEGLLRLADGLAREGASAILLLLNPVRLDLRRPARIPDILSRRWLMIDVDPVRPSTDVMATDEECAAARETTARIVDHLAGLGWPAPVLLDSGNGLHVLYRIDLPQNDDSRNLYRRLLRRLDQQFTEKGRAEVDVKVHHADIHTKLPGSWVRKGPDTPERPHRMARLIHVPAAIQCVPVELIAQAAGVEEKEVPRRSPFVLRAVSEGAEAYGRKALDQECARVAAAPPRIRNDTLFLSAVSLGQLVGGGVLSRGQVESELAAAARACGLDSEREIAATLKSGLNRGEKEPRGLPERNGHQGNGKVPAAPAVPTWVPPEGSYQPFPTDLLPPPADRFVRQAAAAIGCDPAFVALPALTALAAAIGTTRAVVLKKRWAEPAVLWTATVGESGSLKSPGWREGCEHVFRIQHRLLREHREAARRRRGGEGGAEEGPPPCRRIVTSNTTVEKLAKVLAENPRGILMARDELSGWFASFSRYRAAGAGSDLPDWLELHRAGALIIDRKTGDAPTLVVHPASVCVSGTIQPGTLTRSLTGECLEAGLGARLLLAAPPRRRKRWTEDEVSEDTSAAYEHVLEEMFALDLEVPESGEGPAPVYLGLCPEAKNLWVRFYNEWADEQAAAEGELASAFAKIEAYAARLALVHHVTRLADLGCVRLHTPVSKESMAAGIGLARWFAGEARRLYSLFGESESEKGLRTLHEYIQTRGGRITVRDLQRSNNRRYHSAHDAKQELETLVSGGLGSWEGNEFILCTTHDSTTLHDRPNCTTGNENVSSPTEETTNGET